MDDLAVGCVIACLMRGPRGLAPLVPVARVLGGACLLYVLAVMVVRGGGIMVWPLFHTLGRLKLTARQINVTLSDAVTSQGIYTQRMTLLR